MEVLKIYNNDKNNKITKTAMNIITAKQKKIFF